MFGSLRESPTDDPKAMSGAEALLISGDGRVCSGIFAGVGSAIALIGVATSLAERSRAGLQTPRG
jgi:hypothetical protein